ncbi:MAG: hypothetical protein IJG18_02595, partial [Kiritimatiellae bacterium]|nr:hypothetical protein [Kiritimatiellia bacterium]
YLARPQQTGLVDHSTGDLHDQSEGEKRLKSIPLLLTTNFPLLKTTRHRKFRGLTAGWKCGMIKYHKVKECYTLAGAEKTPLRNKRGN